MPKFVELVYGRVLSYFGFPKASNVISKGSSAILQGLSKSVIRLVNEVTAFDFQEYFGSSNFQKLVEGEPATLALEFASFRTFWNTLTSATRDIYLYCFLIKLLLY